MKYAFIRSAQSAHHVAMLCRVLGVSRSGFYDWQRRKPSRRSQNDKTLVTRIGEIQQASRHAYGYRKSWAALERAGITCGKHRVARLRREHGIWAKRRRRFVTATRARHTVDRAPNRLARCFQTSAPDRVWVGDVTFIPTREGWLYLAIQVDLYARSVIGWAMSSRNNSALVANALDMAIEQRQPRPGLIHHTDQGQTYIAASYQKRLHDHGMILSMSRRGDCWDNAVAESFFATLKFELMDRKPFESRRAARAAIFEYIEVFYNRQRLHQTLGYRTPLEVEQASESDA
ncbi:IS3 family transposase [Salinisphaera sp. SPP-AMP-43]|uniref:IS3 family transposase n=1 Tax=Salinisphaera sp. SPP-AMP-43 TaxID=3121288 RepID=UPI003C6E3902